jgi:hypothetical protein
MLAGKKLNLIFAHCEREEELPQAVRSGNIDGQITVDDYAYIDCLIGQTLTAFPV